MRSDNGIPGFSYDVSDRFNPAKTVAGGFILAWLVQIFIWLGAVGLFVYVAWHFIAKFW